MVGKRNKMSKTNKEKRFADGKVEDFKPTTLDQVWGENTHDYQGQTLEEYAEYLSELNKADLQAHAIKKGILPSDNRERTVNKLLSGYKTSLAQSRKLPNIQKKNITLDKQDRQTLSEGR